MSCLFRPMAALAFGPCSCQLRRQALYVEFPFALWFIVRKIKQDQVFARRCRARPNNQRTRKMDRSLFPNTGSANSADPDPSGLEKLPPGADQPALINPFGHDFSGLNPARSLPGLAGIIMRPAGLPSSQCGRGVDTP